MENQNNYALFLKEEKFREEINPLDRLIAIKDFFIFCEDNELEPRSIGAYAYYEDYLKSLINTKGGKNGSWRKSRNDSWRIWRV